MCWNWTTTNNIWPSQCCLSQQSEWCKLDVSANRVWGGRFQKTFFDVRVFNPLTPSNRNQALTAAYRKHEPETKRAYQQCIQVVEHSSFTSLIFSPTGGMDNEATTFYKCLALLFAQKWDSSYSMTLCWLRCCLNYSLLCSSIQTNRSARSSQWHAARSHTAIDLITTESRIHENDHWLTIPYPISI